MIKDSDSIYRLLHIVLEGGDESFSDFVAREADHDDCSIANIMDIVSQFQRERRTKITIVAACYALKFFMDGHLTL